MDVVVVGAGPGGCMAARRCAELGLRTLIVEVKRADRVGDKVCGDAIGAHHFDDLRLTPPRGPELLNEVRGVEVFSPDRRTVFRVEGERLRGFIVDRRAFGARVLKEALDAGAELLDEAQALSPVLKGGAVAGVLVKRRGEVLEVEGKVVIDASGYPAVVRRKAPRAWFAEPPPLSDYVVCHREIRRLEEPLSSIDRCAIYLSQEASPGGYAWVFPRGRWEVNAGLGVQAGRGLNPRDRFYRFVVGGLVPARSSVIHAGGGVVPTRRPLDPLVGDGLMVVGDAACQANPMHGGGIGPAMRAGWLAAEAASRALDAGDVSRRGLWSYAVSFNATYGFKLAALDAFRVFLQSLSDEDLNWGMRAGLVTERDLLAASLRGELKLSFTERARRMLKGAGRLSLLVRLKAVSRAMSKLKSLYLNYPEPEGFEAWRAEVEDVFKGLKLSLA